MSKGSRTDLCGGWPERAIPTATMGVFSTLVNACGTSGHALAAAFWHRGKQLLDETASIWDDMDRRRWGLGGPGGPGRRLGHR